MEGIYEQKENIQNIKFSNAPSINLTQNNTNWTMDNVILTVEADDLLSGLDYIKLPNGDIINDSTFEFIATQNGEYEFEVVDSVGNTTKETITISNIDIEAPILNTEITYNEENTEATIIIKATDSLSGVLSITLPDGKIVNSDITSFIAAKNGDYKVEVMDLVGNTYSETITVDKIKDKPVSEDDNNIPNNKPTDDVTNNNNNNSNSENNLDKLPNSSGLGVFAPIAAMMSLAIGSISFKKKK